jgi:hypothetical protein
MLAATRPSQLLTTSSSNKTFTVVRSQGKNKVVVISDNLDMLPYLREPYNKLNNLEQFFGLWADLTEEEEVVFSEIFSTRQEHFERPLSDLLAEL